MSKWMVALAIGAVATYFVHKTHSGYTWIAAAVTAAIAFMLWRKG